MYINSQRRKERSARTTNTKIFVQNVMIIFCTIFGVIGFITLIQGNSISMNGIILQVLLSIILAFYPTYIFFTSQDKGGLVSVNKILQKIGNVFDNILSFLQTITFSYSFYNGILSTFIILFFYILGIFGVWSFGYGCLSVFGIHNPNIIISCLIGFLPSILWVLLGILIKSLFIR